MTERYLSAADLNVPFLLTIDYVSDSQSFEIVCGGESLESYVIYNPGLEIAFQRLIIQGDVEIDYAGFKLPGMRTTLI